jgi:S1-C subfamily serine protease
MILKWGTSMFSTRLTTVLQTSGGRREMESTYMRALGQCVLAALLFCGTELRSRGAAEDVGDSKIRKSVVKIFAKARRPDPFRPWTGGDPHDVTGSGVVIEGKRILTNAHVVNHASQIFVQPDKSSEKYSASVEVLSPGIDLAVLKLDDDSAFDAHPALPLTSKVPALQQTIFVYGYPEGGSELSITRGIVSRVEFTQYYLSTEGLRVQVDAAINPGNSGGPAVVDGKLVGISFSKLQQSDNIGYIIPAEEIELFLADVKDGRYAGKPVLEIDIQKMENDALRARFKLEKKAKGVLVRRVRLGDEGYPLKVGDVITKIGEHAIDNAGMVSVDGDRMVRFQYLVQRLAKDGRLPLVVFRDGKEQKLDLPVKPAADTLFRYISEWAPSYFVIGPMVLTEASSDFVRSLAEDSGSSTMSLIYSANPIYTRFGDRPAFKDERLVLIAHPLLTHKITKGYDLGYSATVDRVNGVKIKNLKHFVETVRDATAEFIELTFYGNDTDMLVFKRADAIAATEQVLVDNGIRQQCSPDIAPIWNKRK